MIPRWHRDHNRAQDARFDSDRLAIRVNRANDRVQVDKLGTGRRIESIMTYGPGEFIGGFRRPALVGVLATADTVVPYVAFLQYIRGLPVQPDRHEVQLLAMSNAMTPAQLRTYTCADMCAQCHRGARILAWIHIEMQSLSQYMIVDMTGHIPTSAIALTGRHLQSAINMFAFIAPVRTAVHAATHTGRGHVRMGRIHARVCYLHILGASMRTHVLANAAAMHNVTNTPLVVEFYHGELYYNQWCDGGSHGLPVLWSGSVSYRQMVWFPNMTERAYLRTYACTQK